MTGFQHDIAGGQGNLIISALQSPNFVSGVSGWQIAKNGNAQFNNLVIRGNFLGTDYELTPNGLFFYSGALPSPLNNNPYFSNGNNPSALGWYPYEGTFTVTGSPPGLAPYTYAGVYTNTGPSNGAMEESGYPFTITPSGQYIVSAWVYSSVANVVIGCDWQENNTYVSTSTVTVTVTPDTWTLITGTVTAPTSGANNGYVRIGDATNDGMVIYAQAATVYAAGSATLVLAITQNGGLDQFGNPYPAGVTAWNGASYVNMFGGQISFSNGGFISENTNMVFGGVPLEILTPIASVLNAVEPGTTATDETWHTMGTFNTNFSHGTPAPAYKFNVDNTVSLAGQVGVTTGTTSGTVITLPSGWIPQSTKKFAIPINAGTPATTANVQVTITSAGALILSAGPTGAAYTFALDAIRYPLDY